MRVSDLGMLGLSGRLDIWGDFCSAEFNRS